MVKVIERAPNDSHGALMQYLAGITGALITTFPAFIIFPVWWFFSHHYRVVDKDGRDNPIACGLICFIAGCLIWLLATVIFSIGD